MPVSLEDQPARLPGDRRAKLDARAAELIAQEMARPAARLDRTQVHRPRARGQAGDRLAPGEAQLLLFTLRN